MQLPLSEDFYWQTKTRVQLARSVELAFCFTKDWETPAGYCVQFGALNFSRDGDQLTEETAEETDKMIKRSVKLWLAV